MTPEQIKELLNWLHAQAYSRPPEDMGTCIDFEEMCDYLPQKINEILLKKKEPK